MKKSELRAMIREMLHEELAKVNDNKLTESAVMSQDGRVGVSAVSAGSVENAAYDVFMSPEFADALEQDGGVMGDACYEVIASAAISYWPKANEFQLDRVRKQMEVQIGRIMEDDGEYPTYNTHRDPDIQRIMKDRFDPYGNEY